MDRGVTAEPDVIFLYEGRSSASFTVQLSSQPLSVVRIFSFTKTAGDAASNALDAINVYSDDLEFTPQTWNVPQTVRVTADLDADTLDATIQFAPTTIVPITIPANYVPYINHSDTVYVNIFDLGSPTRAVEVMPTELNINEGESASYTVVLTQRPDATVTVTMSGIDTSAATFSPQP